MREYRARSSLLSEWFMVLDPFLAGAVVFGLSVFGHPLALATAPPLRREQTA